MSGMYEHYGAYLLIIQTVQEDAVHFEWFISSIGGLHYRVSHIALMGNVWKMLGGFQL